MAIAAVLLFSLFPLLPSAANAVGEFTCPSGQVEDLQCAAACCQQNGGTYSFSDATCMVDTQAQWNAAMACEQQNDCCTAASNQPASHPSSSGCCGSAFILLAGLGLVGFASMRKN